LAQGTTRIDANKANRPAIAKVFAAMRVLLAALVLPARAGISPVAAGFRSPESLLDNQGPAVTNADDAPYQ
jgi:hypothetical protein